MTGRIPLDHLTSDQYDHLCERLERAEAATDGELRRQLADAIKALGTSETELARLRVDIAACRDQQWPQRLGRAEKRLARIRALADRWVKAGPPPLGTSLARWPDGDVTVMSPRAAAKRLTADDQHVYLSTGCWHGDHDYCQSMTGLNGAKRPGECKFCSAPCQCPCHHDEAKVQPGPA